MQAKVRLLSWATVGVACLLLATAAWVEDANDVRYKAEVRTEAFDDLTILAARLETAVFADAGRVNGLVGVMAANPRIGRDAFERAARAMVGKDSAIRSLSIAPQFVVAQVYPLRGNENVIGLDLSGHPLQRELALAARDRRTTVIAGPLDLVQGGSALIGRAPVFIAEGGQERFWGLVSAAIDPYRLFQASGLVADDLRYELALRGADAKGARGRAFFGRTELFAADPVIVDVRLPDGSWQLAGMPRGGWPSKAPNAWRLRLGFVLVSILILGPILGLGRSMRALGAARTRLDSERRRFNATLENTPNVAVQWYRRDGTVIYWNRASEGIYGWSPQEMDGQTVERLLPEGEYRRFLELLKEVADGGLPHAPVEFEIRRRDGDERVVLSTIFAIPGESGRIVVCMDIDVTESRRLAQMQKDTLESIPDAVVVVDAQGRIVQVNQQTMRLFGYAAKELIGMPVEALLPEAMRGAHLAERRRYMEAPRIRNMGGGLELVARTREGRLIPVDVCLGPIRSTSGHFVVATLRDISERKQVMAELRAARDRAQRYLDTVQTIMVSLDANGGIAMINRKGCELLGYGEEELLGRDWFATCVPVDSAVSLRASLASAVAGGPGDHAAWEYEVVCRDGRQRLIAWRNAWLRDESGAVSGVLSSGEDISDRVAAERRLRESEQRFSIAVDGAGDGVWDWNIQSDEMLCSRTCMQMFGGGEDEEVHRIDDWLMGVHPSDRPQLARARDQVLAGHCTTFAQEFRLRGRTPDYKWVLCRATVVTHDPSGRPLRMIGIMTDISVRKAVEEDLRLARDAAEEANRAKSRFLANMSHELRTPLNAIIGFAQMLDIGAPAPVHEAQKEPIGHILRSARHLLQIINDLLDLARIESGRLELVFEDMLLSPIVDEVIALCRPAADERNIAIAVAAGTGLAVRADRVRLRQVLLNLVSNAIKYNRNDGRVDVACRAKDGLVRITVSDTGPGIPSERRAEAFLPFHRLGAEQGRIEGTGIGLAVTKQLVEAMGGGIGIEDGDGAGASFWVELPLVSVAAATTPVSVAAIADVTADSGEGMVVLYVEDNPVNLRLMQHVFAKRPGLALICAETAEDGLRLAFQHRPALILLDINLPVMDGFEVLRQLRSNPETRQTPVIAVTANAMKGDRERVEAAGFVEYLTKPLNIASLYEVLDRRLHGGERAQADAGSP